MFEPKSVAESIMSKKMPEAMGDEAPDDGMSDMKAMAHDLIQGIHEKDADLVAAALEAFKHVIAVGDEGQDEEMMEQPEE